MTTSDQQHGTEHRCHECGGAMYETRGELVFAYPSYTITVTDIPMKLCRECGERLVSGPVGLAVSQLVSEINESMRQFDSDNENVPAPTDAITIHYVARREAEPAAIS